ncbi:MAG: signal peptidase II [Planctomycetota bacterium]|jgi:signal peptidase II
MTRARTLLLHLSVCLTLLVLDLWTKAAIFRFLGAEVIERPGTTPVLRAERDHVIFPGFALEAAINLGAFNGMLSGVPWLLLGMAVVAAIGTLVIALLPPRMPVTLSVALGMIAGGALGNLYDRVTYGAVRDFVKWYVGDHVWPNFNIADSGIVVGVSLILLHEIRLSRRERAAPAGSTPEAGDLEPDES